MGANRLAKGTVDTNTKIAYTVPLDFVAIVKTVSLCNIGTNDVQVSIKLDGIPIINNEVLSPNQVFNKSIFDHLLKSQEDLTIEVSRLDSLTYYVSGKEAVIDDIGDEKVWMKTVWEEWWQDEGPVMFEQDFNNWWATNGPDNMEQNWQNWFDYIQNATYVDKNDFDVEMSNFQTQFNNLSTDINQALIDIRGQVDTEISAIQQEFTYLENQLKTEIDDYKDLQDGAVQKFRMWGEL